MAKWGNGIGAFLPPENWVYITYGFKINGPGVDETGNFVCRKKSVWELGGAPAFPLQDALQTVWQAADHLGGQLWLCHDDCKGVQH